MPDTHIVTNQVPPLRNYNPATSPVLVEALIREGVLAAEAAQTLLAPEVSDAAYRLLVEAAHRYLALSNARLTLVQVEDATGELEQPNLPGTIDEHPNWRRKLSRPLEEILADPAFRALAAAINEARTASSRRARAVSAGPDPL